MSYNDTPHRTRLDAGTKIGLESVDIDTGVPYELSGSSRSAGEHAR